MHTFFVGGVHGVGKSTCCEQAAEALGIQHRSASAMIRSLKAGAISSTTKAVVSQAENQHILTKAVDAFFSTGEQMLVLAGRFTIPTTAGKVESIPVEVFKALYISGIVVLIQDPQVVWDRRMTRNGTAPDVSSIGAAQALELEHAQRIASALDQTSEFSGYRQGNTDEFNSLDLKPFRRPPPGAWSALWPLVTRWLTRRTAPHASTFIFNSISER